MKVSKFWLQASFLSHIPCFHWAFLFFPITSNITPTLTAWKFVCQAPSFSHIFQDHNFYLNFPYIMFARSYHPEIHMWTYFLFPPHEKWFLLLLYSCTVPKIPLDSLVAQMVTRLPAMLGDLEKEMATHSSTLAWKIPWSEECSRLHEVAKSRTWLSDFTSLHCFPFGALAAAEFNFSWVSPLGPSWPPVSPYSHYLL